MKKLSTLIIAALILLFMSSCTDNDHIIPLTNDNLTLVNRKIVSVDKTTNTIHLNNAEGAGLAILQEVAFDNGVVEIDLKGENTPGRSFVGIAFNIQNDSTYESIYFRPFNFQAKEKIRREHSIQYISLPKNDWRILRTNFEGQFEAAYDKQPSPEDWFAIKIKVEDTKVLVYDKTSGKELLSVKRLEKQTSNKIGLWVGNNSKGAFRNLNVEK